MICWHMHSDIYIPVGMISLNYTHVFKLPETIADVSIPDNVFWCVAAMRIIGEKTNIHFAQLNLCQSLNGCFQYSLVYVNTNIW